MLSAFNDFYLALRAVKAPDIPMQSLEAMRHLYEALDRLNAAHALMLQEVEAVGLKLDDFEYGEPGAEFRTF